MFAGAVTNGEVSVASLGPFLDVDVTGPISLTLEIGEQLAWLGCVCRIADASDGMTLVRPIVSRAYSYPDRLLRPPVSLDIFFQSLEHPAEHAKDGTCWRKLFRNICVADGFATNFRRGEELGLELPFDMMAQLGGAHRAAYWDGQLVLKGFETLFVPVKKAGGCISWHLVTKANRRRISFNTAGDLGELGEQQVHIEDLLSSRHFLGWVPRASQHAGTFFSSAFFNSYTDATIRNSRWELRFDLRRLPGFPGAGISLEWSFRYHEQDRWHGSDIHPGSGAERHPHLVHHSILCRRRRQDDEDPRSSV